MILGRRGQFDFEVPARTVVLHFSLSGYQFSDVTVTVSANETTDVPYYDTVGNPPLATGELRFVLTWGSEPSDLDSHLLTPDGSHVYFADDAPYGAGAYLDVDDTSSYGPETITITTVQAGTYHYFVHNYDEDGLLTSSGAQVRVFDDSGLVTVYYVPTSGTGEYWDVFTLNGSTITPVNTILSYEPTSSLLGPTPRVAK
jgi:hypothetical protein